MGYEAIGGKMETIVIYHGNCADGFGAAWAARKLLGDAADYVPGVYQNPPPDCRGKRVYLVDFSYKRPVMESIIDQAIGVTVLDHHKTAEEDLRSLLSDKLIDGVFDMEKSGAMITWEWFNPHIAPPKLLEHIQDRDLWRFNLTGTREIQAAVFSYPYDFAVWDDLMERDTIDLYREGIAIERKHFKDINELVGVVTRRMRIGGHDVPMANLPYTLTSDAGHKLAEGEPFAGCYWDTPGGRVFSLRSRDDGLDVSEIAKQYGGGGHKNASGFRVPFDELAQFEPCAA